MKLNIKPRPHYTCKIKFPGQSNVYHNIIKSQSFDRNIENTNPYPQNEVLFAAMNQCRSLVTKYWLVSRVKEAPKLLCTVLSPFMGWGRGFSPFCKFIFSNQANSATKSALEVTSTPWIVPAATEGGWGFRVRVDCFHPLQKHYSRELLYQGVNVGSLLLIRWSFSSSDNQDWF